MLGTVSDDPIVNKAGLLGRGLGPGQMALKRFMEGLPETLGHEGIDDGVDGAVHVDAEAAEKEATVEVGRA